jgi:molybdate transport system substrate-binding protein
MRPFFIIVGLWMSALCSCSGSRQQTLSVFASSSLTEAFGALETLFETTHPDVDVRLNFAGSQVLRLQIARGASADVFASADMTHLYSLAGASLVHKPTVFARNRLALIVPPHNPAGLTSLSDLPKATRLVLGSEQVPAGRYGRELIALAGAEWGEDWAQSVMDSVVSVEHNVRLVRAKVALGAADAALVYQTDVNDQVKGIPLPATFPLVIEYGIGLVAGGETELSRQWMGFVLSASGQTVLTRHGFEVPQ